VPQKFDLQSTVPPSVAATSSVARTVVGTLDTAYSATSIVVVPLYRPE
jgi:hypothetical protein